jgi:hypothetical protein
MLNTKRASKRKIVLLKRNISAGLLLLVKLCSSPPTPIPIFDPLFCKRMLIIRSAEQITWIRVNVLIKIIKNINVFLLYLIFTKCQIFFILFY